MNDGLIDAFRHNAWATRELLAACNDLSDEQLNTSAPGTFGSIIDTFRHTIRSDAGYCRRLTGEDPAWYGSTDDSPNLATLAERVDDVAARWERFLAQPFDAERNFVIPWHVGHDYDVPAGIILVQALHHGNEHRAHICTVMTTIGVPTPDIGVWYFAEATGRAKPRAV